MVVSLLPCRAALWEYELIEDQATSLPFGKSEWADDFLLFLWVFPLRSLRELSSSLGLHPQHLFPFIPHALWVTSCTLVSSPVTSRCPDGGLGWGQSMRALESEFWVGTLT